MRGRYQMTDAVILVLLFLIAMAVVGFFVNL